MDGIDDVIESMERFADRHWMHDEGQNVREFAQRLRAAKKACTAEATLPFDDLISRMKARCIDEKHSPELWPFIEEMEAAVKRERAIGYMTKEANERLREHLDIALKNRQVGNSAAMRKAMVEALNKVNDAYDMLSKPCVTLEEVRQACREARGIIIPALSEPARNCDIYTTSNDADRAITEYCSKMAEAGECAKSCPYRGSEGGCAFGWLLAKAAKRKGEVDGCD